LAFGINTEDWSITVTEARLEKIFEINKDTLIEYIRDKWEERFPEETDRLDKEIEDVISQNIDFEKINQGLPSLYYSSGKKVTITKQDLIDYL